jgi:PleD family two-component response regulator
VTPLQQWVSDLDGFIARADGAMYVAKTAGRDQVIPVQSPYL